MDSFDYAAWISRYPEFSTVPQATVTAYFNEGDTLYMNKSIPLGAPRTLYLWMITAHICAIYSGVGGKKPTGIVGRVSSATQGSVSATIAYTPVKNDLQAWFNQTVYGAQYWSATAGYRMTRFVSGGYCGN